MWKVWGMAFRIAAGMPSGPGAFPLGMRRRQRWYLWWSSCPSNMEGAREGVGGMSFAHGNGALGSTVGEGVKVAVACSVTVRMTSCGSVSTVQPSVRMVVREARGAPLLSDLRRCKSWITSLGFCAKSRVMVCA